MEELGSMSTHVANLVEWKRKATTKKRMEEETRVLHYKRIEAPNKRCQKEEETPI